MTNGILLLIIAFLAFKLCQANELNVLKLIWTSNKITRPNPYQHRDQEHIGLSENANVNDQAIIFSQNPYYGSSSEVNQHDFPSQPTAHNPMIQFSPNPYYGEV